MVGRKQIDAILPFLDVFEAEGFQFGELKPPIVEDGKLVVSLDGNYRFSDEMNKFVEALYKNGWIANFAWPSWQDQAIEYVKSPDKVKSADLDTIRKLLTTHVRKDRFCEGHLADMFENGHITALLRRLKDIRVMPHIPREIRKRQHAEQPEPKTVEEKHDEWKQRGLFP